MANTWRMSLTVFRKKISLMFSFSRVVEGGMELGALLHNTRYRVFLDATTIHELVENEVLEV